MSLKLGKFLQQSLARVLRRKKSFYFLAILHSGKAPPCLRSVQKPSQHYWTENCLYGCVTQTMSSEKLEGILVVQQVRAATWTTGCWFGLHESNVLNSYNRFDNLLYRANGVIDTGSAENYWRCFSQLKPLASHPFPVPFCEAALCFS